MLRRIFSHNQENFTGGQSVIPVIAVLGMLQDLIKLLAPREAGILKARFGLDGGSPQTLEQVGESFGVTRERVRQLQNVALNKLRKMIGKLQPAEDDNGQG